MQTATEIDYGKTIRRLNSYLRTEMSAVDTYKLASETVKEFGAQAQLAECIRSHQLRSELLRRRILLLGGKPSEDSGAWGALTTVVESGAKLIGERAALTALEELEFHDFTRYRDELIELDPETQRFVSLELLSRQERTYQTVQALKRNLA